MLRIVSGTDNKSITDLQIKKSFLYCLLLTANCQLFFSSCSQQKNRWINRAYHSTTTRYNIFFNGNESFKEGVFSIESSHKDDYTKVLPVFVYGDENSAKSAFPQMDNAIKKASKSVQRHSMYIKEVEYNEWIDDCYLLVGKAEFYKREYRKALATFEYVAKDFKHKEIKHEAMLWMVRCYIELNDFSNANKFMNLITSDVVATEQGLAQKSQESQVRSSETKKTENKKTTKKTTKKTSAKKKPSAAEEKKKEFAENHVFPQSLKDDYYGVYADFFIRQNQYSSAIPQIQNCILFTKKKKRKVRLLYILAQLYHKERNYEMAVRYYSQVLKLRPSYEMEFYAQINRAMAYDVGAGSSNEIKAQLHKMMKDEKNKEFFDQIYYALADIEIKEGNEEKGIEYLITSTQSRFGGANNNQKGLSFLRLADIYFDKKKYPLAQQNYDSAITFLNKDRADYQNIVSKRNNLTKLVKNILIIEREDSLQRLAGLSEKERNKVADEIIRKILDDEERKKQEQQQTSQTPSVQNQQGATTGGEWYFYNPSTLGFGFAEFKKIWGDRILEDNWRRKNKTLAAMDVAEVDLIQPDDHSDTATANQKDRNYYLKNIPLTSEKMNKSHNKIIEAYYDLGVVYREQFDDNNMAKKTFETLISKYDTCRYVLPSYYHLYKIELEEKNSEKAEFYRQKIMKEFPNSEYAKVLANPNYFAELYKEKSKSEELYKTTYELYKQQYFSEVIANCNASDSLFPESHLSPKFHFLKALSFGKSGDLKNFETALKTVIEKHPQTAEASEAQKMLDLFLKNKPLEPEVDSSEFLYQFNSGSKHSCVLILPITENANDIKIAISDFNTKYFSLSKLNVSDALLDNNRQLISIKFFDEMNSAVTYFKAFKNDNEILQNINEKNYTLFLISTENFAIFYNQKKVDGYISFFTKNYPVN